VGHVVREFFSPPPFPPLPPAWPWPPVPPGRPPLPPPPPFPSPPQPVLASDAFAHAAMTQAMHIVCSAFTAVGVFWYVFAALVGWRERNRPPPVPYA